MPASLITFREWASAFRELDASCPWPGPRPLESGRDEDELLLVGRRADEESFADDVLSHQLVVLTADSGVGKSSLLNVGLDRRLRSEGFIPLVCNDWTNRGYGDDDPERFLVQKLQGSLPPGIDIEGTDMGSLCSQLDCIYGERAVLILDQFEELIRYQRRLFHSMLEWLLQVNQNNETHVVLSMRSEYTHRLRWLESRVRPFSMANYVLEALQGNDVMAEVVRSGNRTRSGSIDEGAVGCLLQAWNEQLADDNATSTDVGLLHLQAALYALHARSGGAVLERHVIEMQEDGIRTGLKFFDLALQEAVRLKLDRCQAACRHPSLPTAIDDVLIEGTMGMVQRASGQLSSGGYKLVREEWELARNTLSRELDSLDGHATSGTAEAIFRRLTETVQDDVGPDNDGDDLLTVKRAAIYSRPDSSDPLVAAAPPELRNIGIVPAPWDADPDDLSSGPMFGMDPTAILVEELRRFIFAVEWLRSASLVRASSPAAGQTMLSLIHDGFGPALEAWSKDHRAGPARAINLLTAAHGEKFDWQSDRIDKPAFNEFDGRDGFVTISNVRWRDCQVSASFRRIVFVNCDFRGSRFEHCAFRGVVFVNCLLDGATFGQCTVFGTVSDHTDVASTLPDFKVPVEVEEVHKIVRYRDLEGSVEPAVYSRTSGLPAMPWRPQLGEGVPWSRQKGGLTMYGGRLSSLMIRDCLFDDNGTLAFRHIAGSSLDIVEQTGGCIDVYDSAIRGFTVTRQVEAADPDAVREYMDENAELVLAFRGSVMADTWFGPQLQGKAVFSDCLVWQLLNLSDRQRFEVEIIDGCGYVGLANVAIPDQTSEPRSEFRENEILERDEIVRIALRMDYRSTPARLEIETD